MVAVLASLLMLVATTRSGEVRTARDVRALPVPEAQKQRPVRLAGTVTFSPPSGQYFYLQDETGGVRVEWAADRKLRAGDEVEVVGVTTPGTFLPEVRADRTGVAVRGKAGLPKPVPFTLTRDETAYLDGQWVEVVAVVQRAWEHQGWLQLDLARGRGDAVAYLPAPLPARIREAEGYAGGVYRVRGVCRVNAGAARHPTGSFRILVGDLSAFEQVKPPPADPFGLPATPAGALALFHPDPLDARAAVRVDGVVTLNQANKQLYVHDGGVVVHASFVEAVGAKPGDRVSVVGFPRPGGDPVRLDNARARVVGAAPLPAPRPGDPVQAHDGKAEGHVATFTGLVHETGRQGDWMTLTVVVDGLTFTAIVLEELSADADPPPPPGSRVEVAGVVTRQPLDRVRPAAFAVMARPGGVRVVEPAPVAAVSPPPPWWSGRRVAYLVVGFVGLLMLGGATVTAMRLQVRRAAALARRQSEENARLEGRLEVAARFEAVGRLAGGVAHDFNNILTVINGCAQLLDEEIASDPTHAATLAADIRRAGRLAAAITHLLLAFSRQRPVARHPLDLNALIADAAPILARLVGGRTTLNVSAGPNLPPVLAETGMLLQVLINLAVNAGEAMPEGGAFTLATAAPAPGWVRLTAADTGAGMTGEVKGRALERGFTTKPAGTGTGLSTVADIVQTLGARLRFRSEVGRGTVFEIDLPAPVPPGLPPHRPRNPAEAPTVTVAQDDTITTAPPRPARAPVVLLVDDDEAVRALAGHILERAGLHVLAATDAEEALRLLAGHAGPVDLLLTDVVLPGLTGGQLAERARAVRPGVRVLFMSGHAPDELPEARGEPGTFLHKPFAPRDLVGYVRNLLGQPVG